MTSQRVVGPVSQCLLPLFLLICFGGVFYIYFQPTIRWAPCSDSVTTHEVCTDQCLSVFIKKFFTNLSDANTFNSTLCEQELKDITQVMEKTSENHDLSESITMLIWSWPFGFTFHEDSCRSEFGIKGCHFTGDRRQYVKAHGVMFHHRDIGGGFTDLLRTPRPPHQKWVWMNMESPDNCGPRKELDGLFNLTVTYRSDSDIWVPYGRIIEASENEKTFKIPKKDKLVCWIVSNWNPNFRRVKYFNELKQYIKIEAYGRQFRRYVSHEDYIKILPSCKFYLSFENSIRKDYFTEKVFNPMKVGTVPVVLGPPRENYEELIPADSFIHVDDFKSPKELAERLTYLDQNQDVYEQYFTWRQFFTAQSTYFGLEHACRSCDYIRKHKGYRVFKNLNKWYWG